MSEMDTPRQSHPFSTDLVISICLAVLFAAALLATLGWPFQTALFPMIVSGAALLLGLAHIAALLVRYFRGGQRVAAHAEDVPLDEEDADHDLGYMFATAGKRAWTAALGWSAAFFLGMYLLGLLLAAPLFSFAYLRFSARKSWLFSVVYAIVILVALYLAFDQLLTIPIPAAIWEQS